MVKPVTLSFQDNYCFHEQKLLIAFHPMWSLYLGRQLDWADHHSTSRPVVKFEEFFGQPKKVQDWKLYLLNGGLHRIYLAEKEER